MFPLLVLDNNLIVRDCSRQISSILGWSHDELVGRVFLGLIDSQETIFLNSVRHARAKQVFPPTPVLVRTKHGGLRLFLLSARGLDGVTLCILRPIQAGHNVPSGNSHQTSSLCYVSKDFIAYCWSWMFASNAKIPKCRRCSLHVKDFFGDEMATLISVVFRERPDRPLRRSGVLLGSSIFPGTVILRYDAKIGDVEIQLRNVPDVILSSRQKIVCDLAYSWMFCPGNEKVSSFLVRMQITLMAFQLFLSTSASRLFNNGHNVKSLQDLGHFCSPETLVL